VRGSRPATAAHSAEDDDIERCGRASRFEVARIAQRRSGGDIPSGLDHVRPAFRAVRRNAIVGRAGCRKNALQRTMLDFAQRLNPDPRIDASNPRTSEALERRTT
jgi:hypothetical protein